MGSPLLPSSLIFEKFEKSVAVPDMAPEPISTPPQLSLHLFPHIFVVSHELAL